MSDYTLRYVGDQALLVGNPMGESALEATMLGPTGCGGTLIKNWRT